MKKLLAVLMLLLALGVSRGVEAYESLPMREVEGMGSAALFFHTLNGYTILSVGCATTGSSSLKARLDYIAGRRAWEQANNHPTEPYLIRYTSSCTSDYNGTLLPMIPTQVAIDGNGATLKETSIRIRNVQYVYIQNLRVTDSPINTDCFEITNAQDVALVHVSGLRCFDGSVDITNGSQSITVQDSLLGSPVDEPPSNPTRASTNMLLGDTYADLSECESPCHTLFVSLIRNLFVDGRARNPRILQDNLGTESCFTNGAFTAEVVNNVVANWGNGQGTTVVNGACANVIGNVYTDPAGSSNDQQDAIIVCSSVNPCTGFNNAKAYVSGNVLLDQPSHDLNAANNSESQPFNGGASSVSACGAGGASELVLGASGVKTGGRNSDETTLVNSVTGC